MTVDGGHLVFPDELCLVVVKLTMKNLSILAQVYHTSAV